MPVDFSKTLVVGLSSRALFDLDAENKIYEEDGLEEFRKYQKDNRDNLLNPGTSFPLVKALLRLNDSSSSERRVEVILMSRNHPDVVLRVFDSIEQHGLDITRAALTGGNPVTPYLKPFQVDLFLSKDEADVAAAIRDGVPAGIIYQVPEQSADDLDHVRIAFDGDCVLFDDEAQKIYDDTGDVNAFLDYERQNAKRPLGEGPFAKLLKTIKANQRPDLDKSPFHVALVTARNAPAHERAFTTLESWGVRVDQAFFMGGLPKDGVLKEFRPHIFIDDTPEHCESAARYVPTARVPRGSRPAEEVLIGLEKINDRFLLVCKSYLGRNYEDRVETIEKFYAEKVSLLEPKRQLSLIEELESSVTGTPKGEQRRAGRIGNTQADKLMQFLENLVSKYQG